ncbi:MAG: hypothetical protein ACYC9U_12230 [Nitrososphaerales archaeon]
MSSSRTKSDAHQLRVMPQVRACASGKLENASNDDVICVDADIIQRLSQKDRSEFFSTKWTHNKNISLQLRISVFAAE